MGQAGQAGQAVENNYIANLGPRVGQAGQVAETNYFCPMQRKRGKRQKSVSSPAEHAHLFGGFMLFILLALLLRR